jgi:hypothetical protein
MSSSGKSKTIGKAATPPVQRSAAQPAKDTSVAKPSTANAEVQRKLEVGSPNDVYEQQADAMAEQVVKMTEADVAAKKQQAPKNKAKTAVQAKAQPGSFLFRKANPVISPKTEEKVQKNATPELKKKADEKVQQKQDESNGGLQSAGKEKLQKAADAELKKKADEKLQKAADAELKKKADEKLQKATEEKLQKAADAELKKKADEKLQKATEEKLQKAADAELKKKSEEKQREISLEKQKIAFEAGQKIKKKTETQKGEEKIQQTIQRKNAQEQQRQVSNAQVTQQIHEPKQRTHEVTEKDLRRKPEQKEEEKIKKKDEPLKKKAEEKPQKKQDQGNGGLQSAGKVKVQKQAVVQLVRTITPAPPAPRRTPKEEDKIKKKADEKLQKAAEEKVQKTTEKATGKDGINPVSPATAKPAVARTILPKEDDKLKKKADEKLQKASEEKVQKAEIKPQRKNESALPATAPVRLKEEDKLKKKQDKPEAVEKPTPENLVTPAFESQLAATLGGGRAMDDATRAYMEARFGVDFSAVRIHTDATAAKLCVEIGAQAFAYKNHIYFSAGRYQPGTERGKFLLAHELTHVIQQGYAPEADPAQTVKSPVVATKKETVQRNVEIKQAPPSIQRVGIRDSLAALAANIPGWTLLTLVIGRNPINNEVVDRNALNVLRAFMGLIPGGEMLFQVLSSYGIMEKIATWTEQQVDALGITYSALSTAFGQFVETLGPADIFSPGDVWERAKNIFTPFITRIGNFVSSLISQAIAWLKEKFMKPLSEFCVQIPGYKLVTVLLGNDPFTNEAVPATAMNVVKAFAEFIPGGTEKVKELEESKGLQKAYDWFIQETTARNLTWARISGTFTSAWNSLKLEDVLEPVATLQRIGGMFSPLFTDLVGFAQAALMKLLEIIYEAVMGAGGSLVLSIIKKSAATFKTIIQNPVGFLGNLVTAVGMGIRQFGGNILKHLQTGVITWLTGTLTKAGIKLPENWDLKGILGLIMQILGLTWPRIRGVAVEVFGANVVDKVEKVAGFVMDVKEKGFIQTIKDRINEYFSGLKEMVLGKIKSFIQERIVMAGIAQLVSLLSPVGAVIQAIIKTYQTVMFFIQKINQILQFVNSVVDSIASIAAGSLGAAASYIEQTMARTIPLILDFLARMIGLGDISGKIKSAMEAAQNFIMGKIRQGMMWVKAQVIRLFNMAKDALVEWWKNKKAFTNKAGETHTLSFKGSKSNAKLYISTTTMPIEAYLAKKKEENKDNPAILAKIATAEGIISAKNSIVFKQGTTPDEEKKKQDDVIAALGEISQALMDLGGGDFKDPDDYPAPETPVGGAPPSSIEFKLLSKAKLPKGTPTTGVDHGTHGWPYVTKNKLGSAKGDKWVQMHLISEKIGGTAVGGNLIPAPNSVNSAWRSGIESGAQALINQAAAGAGKPATVIWFKTTVSYFGDALDGYKFASGVSSTAGLYAYKGKTNNKAVFEKAGGSVFSMNAQIMWPELALSDKASLNKSSGTHLKQKGGVADVIVNDIKRLRPYASMPDFITKMSANVAAKFPNPTHSHYITQMAAINAVPGLPNIVVNDIVPE